VTDGVTQAARGPTREAVLAALRTCFDPCCAERGISVVDMGLVEQIAVDGPRVAISLILTSGWCPFVARLDDMIRDRVATVPGVGSVEVSVVWDPVWTPGRMSGEARQKLRLPLEQLEPLRQARSANRGEPHAQQ
jgi:metal-sulfur cluster biosynthetic enzyme